MHGEPAAVSKASCMSENKRIGVSLGFADVPDFSPQSQEKVPAS